jgi:hypothetical protein
MPKDTSITKIMYLLFCTKEYRRKYSLDHRVDMLRKWAGISMAKGMKMMYEVAKVNYGDSKHYYDGETHWFNNNGHRYRV